jgi:hypothetical protein
MVRRGPTCTTLILSPFTNPVAMPIVIWWRSSNCAAISTPIPNLADDASSKHCAQHATSTKRNAR